MIAMASELPWGKEKKKKISDAEEMMDTYTQVGIKRYSTYA